MTPVQAEALALIRADLADARVKGAGWLKPSHVMAHCEIESSWRPGADSADGLGSIGLMQVLPATARLVGVAGDQAEPANSILAGMRWLSLCHAALRHWFGEEPPPGSVVAAYNEGPGNVEKGNPDDEYVSAWRAAQAKWAFVDGENP